LRFKEKSLGRVPFFVFEHWLAVGVAVHATAFPWLLAYRAPESEQRCLIARLYNACSSLGRASCMHRRAVQ
jgi:hypothetical protein